MHCFTSDALCDLASLSRSTKGVGCALLPNCLSFHSLHGPSFKSLILVEMEKVVLSQLGKKLENVAKFGVFNRVIVRRGKGIETIAPVTEPKGFPHRCQILLYVHGFKSAAHDDNTLTAHQQDTLKRAKTKKKKEDMSLPPSLAIPPWLFGVSPMLYSLFDKLITWLLDSLRRLYRVFSINLMFFAGGDDGAPILCQAFHTDYEPEKIFEHFDSKCLLRPLLAVFSFSYFIKA